MYYELVEDIGENGRIIRSIEQESYFDVFGEPDGYTDADGEEISPEDERRRVIDLIEIDGLWYYEAQVRCKCCGSWDTVDSIGMVIGDLTDSGYREDFIDAIKAHKG